MRFEKKLLFLRTIYNSNKQKYWLNVGKKILNRIPKICFFNLSAFSTLITANLWHLLPAHQLGKHINDSFS